MFGQSGFGGFGQSQPQQAASPFGATPAANPFGAPAFGQPQQAPAFGGGMFGQASAPAFGAASAPAFGAAAPAFGAQQPRPAFGGAFGATPAFGASQPAFGAATAPAFGMQQSQPGFGVGAAPSFGLGGSSPAFGAASAPAFGAASAPAFGAPNPFGGSTFGASSPAFGATSAPAFGMGGAAPAFGAASAASPFGGGSSIFGSTASPGGFGAAQQPQQQQGLMFGAGGAFGMQQQQQVAGTRAVAYQKTVEKESSAAGASGIANYITITAMPAYASKSQEELRWEDYQQGVKSAAAGPPQQQATGGLFGSAPAFGQAQAAAPATGFGTGAFGTSTPAFGQPQAAPAFGSPSSAAAFGSAPTASFGFGQQPASSGFGAAPTGGFFGASSAAFGQSQAAPSMFGSAPSFASSPSIFGNTAAAFGALASSASPFSFSTSPSIFSTQPAAAPAQPSAFGAPNAANPFGTTLSPFSSSAAGGGLFAPSTTSAFGTGAFGQKPAAPFQFPSAAPGTGFGNFSFSSAATSSPGLFGSTTGSAFTTATAPASGGFNFASSPGLFNSPIPGYGQAQAMAQGPPPSVGQAPYGAFPALPAVSEPKVGISARPVNKGAAGGVASGAGALRNSPLLSLRSAGTMPRFGVQVRSTGASPLALIVATPAPTPASTAGDGTPSAMQSSGSLRNGAAPANGGMLMLPARANPHRLFIREPPPGTEAASTTSPVLTPIRSPHMADGGGHGYGNAGGTADAATPDRSLNGDYGGGNHHAAPRGGGTPPRRAHDDGALQQQAADSVLPRLGRLAAEGYSYEPSPVQLQAMYSSDPASLRNVSGFIVTRKAFGQIRWLRPVDVTGLALHRIVTIGDAEVYCYADEDKPPVGQGLNTEAEVTLYNVYKRDPQTKQPIREGPAVLRWERQLRTMCAKLGAKFVSYKADGGVWKFEVEHFSRYGLLDLEDDDIEEIEELPGPGEVAARKQPIARFGLMAAGDATEDSQGMSDEERDGWLTVPAPGAARRELPTYMEEEEGIDTEGGQQEAPPGAVVFGVSGSGYARGADAHGPLAGPPLQHSLPGQLNLDPSGLMAMHGSLFGERVEAQGLAALGPAAAMAVAEPSTHVEHVWRRGPSPLTSSSAGTRALLSKEPVSPALTPMGSGRAGITTAGAGAGSTPGPSTSAGAGASWRTPGTARTPGLVAGAAAAGAASMLFVDAGLCLGPSFRAGWGPGGKLVYPGNMAQCHAVHVRRVLVEGASADGSDTLNTMAASGAGDNSDAPGSDPKVAALRKRLRAALEVHLQYASPDVPPLSLDGDTPAALAGALVPAGLGGAQAGDGASAMDVGGEAGTAEAAAAVAAAPSVPRWSLQCDRRGLARLVDSYLAAPESEVALLTQQQQQQQGATGGPSIGGAASELTLMRRHEAETWRLVQALWEHIEGEGDLHQGQGQAQHWRQESAGGGLAEGGESSLGSLDMFAPQSALAAFRRRRAVGQWLRRQAKLLVEAELSTVGDAAEATLRLAAAGQTAAAAAVAVAAGDVRLATLLAQAGYGLRSEVRDELQEQLLVWERSDMLRHIAPDRLLLYRMLAGQVDEVRDRLTLDWRRYLGLLLGYVVLPTASPAEAIQQYTTTLAIDRAAPRPTPLYSDERASLGRCHARDTHSPSARDLHYELLCLWAEQQQQQQQAVAGQGYNQDGDAAPAFAAPVGADVLAALLQAATYSPNPLGASQAWHVMTLLQALGVLTLPATGAAQDGSEDWQAVQEQYSALLAVQMNLLTQLQLAGDMAEWQVYVALHTPEPPTWPGLRTHLVRELLTLNCQEWLVNVAKTTFLVDTLGLPQALLSEAEATWARYQGDDVRQCAALMAAGATRQAHDLLITSVAPALFLSGRVQQLRSLLELLAAPSVGVAPVPAAEWEAGGGLYLSFLSLFGVSDGPSAAASGATRDEAEVGAVLARLQAAGDRLAAVANAIAAGGAGASLDGMARQQQLSQQLAYSRMAHKLHQVVMGTSAGAGAALAASGGAFGAVAAKKLRAMQGVLGLHDSCLPSELRMSGIATAAAAVTAAAADAR